MNHMKLIGFHGKLYESMTPAIMAPVIDDGTYIDPDVWSIAGTGTKLNPEIESSPGHVIIAIGELEQTFIYLVRDAFDDPDFWDFVDSKRCFDERLKAWRQGFLVFWYTEIGMAKQLMSAIASVARSELRRSIASRASNDILEKSWWLTRASQSDEDLLEAMEGFKLVDYRHVKVLEYFLTTTK